MADVELLLRQYGDDLDEQCPPVSLVELGRRLELTATDDRSTLGAGDTDHEDVDVRVVPDDPGTGSTRRWPIGVVGVAAAAVLVVLLVLSQGDGADEEQIFTDTEAPERTDDNETPDPEPSIQPSEDESSTDADPDVVVFDDFESSQVWTEIDPPPAAPVGELSSSGGVFYVIGRDFYVDPGPLATSTDGVEWTDHELPDGLLALRFAASADRWAVVAHGPDRFLARRVFISDDRGETWTELDADLTAAVPPSPYLDDPTRKEITDVGVLGTTVVVATITEFFLNPDSISDEEMAARVGVSCGQFEWNVNDGVVSDLRIQLCDGGGEVKIEDPAALGPDSDQIVAALAADGTSEITMLTSLDGEPLAPTESIPAGHGDPGLAVANGFALNPTNQPIAERVKLTSTDGVAWTQPDTTGLRSDGRHAERRPAERPDGLWVAGTTWSEPGQATLTIQHTTDGARWEDIATFPGLGSPQGGPRIVGGPAGLAATTATIDARPEAPRFERPVVGWTVNGVDWQWQPAEDAFGLEDGSALHIQQLAVGTEGAIAVVEVESDNQPSRWFITLR